MSAEPLYFSKELPKAFQQAVLDPLKENPALFSNDDVLPIPRVNLVFGRRGVGKKGALLDLLNKHGISHMLINGEQEMTSFEPDFSFQVLVIENGHALVLPPYATDNSRTFALRLKEMAQQLSIIVFCLVDVPPTNMTLADRDLLSVEFLQKFDNTIYFDAPPVDQALAIFKWQFAQMFAHVEKYMDHPCLDRLTEDDYKYMVDCAGFATPLDIQKFVQRVARIAIQNPSLEVDRTIIELCMYSHGPLTQGIAKESGHDQEQHFARFAGISIPSMRAVVEHEREQEQKNKLEAEIEESLALQRNFMPEAEEDMPDMIQAATKKRKTGL